MVHNQKVETQVKQNLKDGRSNWRVACALFSYMPGAARLKPLGQFNKPGIDQFYPSISADAYLKQELEEDRKRQPNK